MERIKPTSITPEQAREYYRNTILGKPTLGLKDMYALSLANLIGSNDDIGKAILAHERAEIACLNRKTGKPVEEIIKHPHQIPKPDGISRDYCHRVTERYERRFG